MLNIEEIRLIFLLKNTTCSLSLTNTSDIISIDIHRTFASDDKFRFTHQWSNFGRANLVFWPQWPMTAKCLNWYLNNVTRNDKKFPKLKLNSFQCPLVNVLMHSTSRELFTEEQTAVSNWLDLQYKASIDQTNKLMNTRRLAPFEIAKNSKVCSNEFQNWILKYQKWHENISFIINNGSMTFEEQRNRIIEHDVRFLIFEKHVSGIADRIIHLISTYFVALLTNRLFIFDENWPEFIDVLQSSLNYERKLVIPWFSQLDLLNENLSLNNRNYLSLKTRWFSFDRYTNDYDYEKTFPERILLFKGHTGGVIHTIESNSSIYKKFLNLNLKMNTSQIFGCLYNSLFAYRLSELIKRVSLNSTNEQLGHSSQQILQILLSPRFFPIGIQIRVGDRTMVETNSLDTEKIDNFMSFFTCAQDIIDKNVIRFKKTGEKGITFLLSDSLKIRQVALERWQFPLKCFQSFEKNECRSDNESFYILAHSNPVLHIQFTKNPMLAFQLGIFDAFLFSLCEEHIITTQSGFGRLPAFVSLKQRNIYSLNRDEKHSCQDQGLTLAISGHHWSGIK